MKFLVEPCPCVKSAWDSVLSPIPPHGIF